MGVVYVLLAWLRDLKISPTALVVGLAVAAAYVEQRLARRRMADLTSARPDEAALREARREARRADRRRRSRGQ